MLPPADDAAVLAPDPCFFPTGYAGTGISGYPSSCIAITLVVTQYRFINFLPELNNSTSRNQWPRFSAFVAGKSPTISITSPGAKGTKPRISHLIVSSFSNLFASACHNVFSSSALLYSFATT